jgi:UPF0716 protein FxsA
MRPTTVHSSSGCSFFLVGIPLLAFIELSLLVRLGSAFGAIPTAALFLTTSLLGVTLLRRGGLTMLADVFRWGQRAAAGETLDELPIATSAPRLLAGMLLLVPGFMTDLIGLLCLAPPARWWIAGAVQKRFADTKTRLQQCADAGPGGGPIIDGTVVSSRPATNNPSTSPTLLPLAPPRDGEQGRSATP